MLHSILFEAGHGLFFGLYGSSDASHPRKVYTGHDDPRAGQTLGGHESSGLVAPRYTHPVKVSGSGPGRVSRYLTEP